MSQGRYGTTHHPGPAGNGASFPSNPAVKQKASAYLGVNNEMNPAAASGLLKNVENCYGEDDDFMNSNEACLDKTHIQNQTQF